MPSQRLAVLFAAASLAFFQTATATVCNYPGGSCYELRLQLCSGASQFTLHGLWPEWQQDCGGASFDVSLLSPIRSQLEADWPSCYGETNESFWEHEWIKHGTCSGLDELSFFKQALALQQQYAGQCSGLGDCSICFSRDLSSQETCSAALLDIANSTSSTPDLII